MTRHVVVGTAGHVDHGKTALVKALTGTDTDRWEEEKRRGITIDLGFARLDLGDDQEASVVDVPGHEDFVRNMVAGATGVDVALLVVAADEGVMPQTVEHLAILDFLAVRSGAVALTKVDLVEPEWLELVQEDLTDRLGTTSITWERPVPVSAKTGEGVDALRVALGRAAVRAVARDEGDLFRMPVDRVFSVAGAGTVVTGTVWTGRVAAGDSVRLLPGDHVARVRSVEVHGHPADVARPGRRTALALVGSSRDAARRGTTVVSDETWRPTERVDVRATLLAHARPLTQRSRIRVHLGTAEVMARVTPAEGEIGPGETGVVRLRLEEPLVCRWGDLGVFRSYSPVTTVGGFVVIDPWPAARPRRPAQHPERYDDDPLMRLVAATRALGAAGMPVADLPVRLRMTTPEPAELEGAGLVAIDGRIFPQDVPNTAAARALEALAEFHRRHPLQLGLRIDALRQALGSPAIAEHARVTLETAGRIEVEDGLVRLAEHAPTLAGGYAEIGERVTDILIQAGPRGVSLADLEQEVSGASRDLLEFLVRKRTAIRVGAERYYAHDAITAAVRTAVDRISQTGEATPAELRDALGLTRKYLIPLLEWLDGQGITMRVGDARRLGPKAPTSR